MIPTSVLGGAILLIVAGIFDMMTGDVMFETQFFGGRGYQALETITYHSLALGFIASTLKATKGKLNKKRANEIFNTGVTTVSTYLLQAVLGLGITIVAALVMTNFFSAAGVLLPFGFGQGTGPALNYGTIYENHKKLSKRCGHSSYEDLIEQGFLTEAVVNFVALLGWSPEDDKEIFSLEELIAAFNYRHMGKAPSVFDYTKLKWMNGEYLKAMDFDAFYELAEPYIKEVITKDLDLKKIAAMVKTRIEVFPEIPALIDFFEAVPEYDVAMYTHKKMKTNAALKWAAIGAVAMALSGLLVDSIARKKQVKKEKR